MSRSRLFLALLLLLPLLASRAAAEDEESPGPAPAPKEEPAPAPKEEPETDPLEDPKKVIPSRPGYGPPMGTEPGWVQERFRPPTAADWAKPVLLTFQRTWDDAVAVSKETGKPIMICINMDGEPASEHYAGVRYRDPETTELYKPYVLVIASVYRHNPRDYDDEGNRILCPRFGSVTCGEHIAIEPIIYEKYCEGQRVAPRHIALDLDFEEIYDVYYANDVPSVLNKVQNGIAHLPPPKPPIVRGDRPILERVASRHVEDRTAVEAAYRKGDAAMRKKLLEAAIQHGDAEQLDLLRLAIFGLDVDLGKTAREALAHVETPQATELISESLQVPMDASERDALIATLERLGESSVLARWLAGVHKGLAAKSTAVDPAAWTGRHRVPDPVPDADTLAARAEYQAAAAEASPEDPAPRLELADASLALAMEAPNAYGADARLARIVTRAALDDAGRAARQAEALGASGWDVDSVLTIVAYYTGDREGAYERAARAVKAMPPDDPSWRSMAVTTIFAESRWMAIKAAVRAKETWPAEWLADLHAAYALLQKHPLGTDDQVVWHYEFLVWLGAEHRASRVLREGLQRFWSSHALHQRLRERILKYRGVDALEPEYEALLAADEDPVRMSAFAGLASVAAAEQYRRTNEREKALASYAHAVAYFERGGKAYPDGKAAYDQAIALALAGRARVEYELGRNDAALADVLGSFELSPDSAGNADGMGITPGQTGQALLAQLLADKDEEAVAKLSAAMKALDPELLRSEPEPAPWER